MDRGMHKVVIVTRRTRLEELKQKYNTVEQARFYVEHLGADFGDYLLEDQNYRHALAAVTAAAGQVARVQVIPREYIANMIFGENDIVIAVGQDGLVANVMKYLDRQPLIGVNPDPARWDGKLLPFAPKDVGLLLPDVIGDRHREKAVTMAKAEAKDGQVLYAANDFFLGISDHTSARYTLSYRGKTEHQSSSGVIVSTGLGMSGWHKSIMAQLRGMAGAFGLGNVREPTYSWDEKKLRFSVREPYPSCSTGAEIVYGEINGTEQLVFTSNMPEKGVVFSDGIAEDAIAFHSGMEVKIGIAERQGRLVF